MCRVSCRTDLRRESYFRPRTLLVLRCRLRAAGYRFTQGWGNVGTTAGPSSHPLWSPQSETDGPPLSCPPAAPADRPMPYGNAAARAVKVADVPASTRTSARSSARVGP